MKKIRTPHILLLAVVFGQLGLAKLLEVLNVGFSMAGALAFSQLTILIPFAIYCILKRKNPLEIIRFRKIRPISVFFVIMITVFSYPVVIFLNMVSMMFVENAMADVMPSVLEMGLLPGLFFMAMMPAIVEETIFRGTLYNTYSKYNPVAGVLFSAFLFGLMHMNFNQMPYAIYLGIIMALVLEACDSILASMIVHFTMNATSTVLVFVSTKLQGISMNETVSETTNIKGALIESFKLSAEQMGLQMSEAQIESMAPMILAGTIGMFAVFAVIALIFVLILIYALFGVNGRKPKEVFAKKEGQKKRLIDIWVIIFMIYAFYECIVSIGG